MYHIDLDLESLPEISVRVLFKDYVQSKDKLFQPRYSFLALAMTFTNEKREIRAGRPNKKLIPIYLLVSPACLG